MKLIGGTQTTSESIKRCRSCVTTVKKWTAESDVRKRALADVWVIEPKSPEVHRPVRHFATIATNKQHA